MRVLFVHKIIGIAGSENYLIQVLKGLKDRGIDVEFLSLTPARLKGSERKFIERINDISVKHTTVYYSFPFILTFFKIAKLLRKNKIDIVHSHLIHADLFLAVVKSFFYFGFKLVSTKHGYEESYNNNYGFDPKFKKRNVYWWLAKWAERKMDKSYAISEGLKNLYIGLGICKQEKLELIHYGFDYNAPPNTANYRYSKNQLVIVGRLTAFKGHRYAFHALKMLVGRFQDIKLVVVGSGPLEDELTNLVEELNISSNVNFMGYNPEGRAIMSESDVVLIPSVAEGFGVVVLEAFSTKKPIVAFDVPSLNEHIVSGESGILVQPYDIVSYASQIEFLLKNREKSQAIGMRGYEKLTNDYNLNKMVSSTISFYQSL